MTAVQLEFSRQVADAIPSRVLTFLRAIAASREIRGVLVGAGYGQADHDFGWEKLLSVVGYGAPLTATVSTASADAMRQLDAEHEMLLRRAEAALRRFHPAQAELVFDNSARSEGGALVAIATFLERLDVLECDPDREATRVQDRQALAKLATRGITRAERERLAKLVRAARTVVEAPPPSEAWSEQWGQDLAALRDWYLDWSDTARAVITRRDFLIRLGLAKRKPAGSARKANGSPTERGATDREASLRSNHAT